jgi:hypothetical protein
MAGLLSVGVRMWRYVSASEVPGAAAGARNRATAARSKAPRLADDAQSPRLPGAGNGSEQPLQAGWHRGQRGAQRGVVAAEREIREIEAGPTVAPTSA